MKDNLDEAIEKMEESMKEFDRKMDEYEATKEERLMKKITVELTIGSNGQDNWDTITEAIKDAGESSIYICDGPAEETDYGIVIHSQAKLAAIRKAQEEYMEKQRKSFEEWKANHPGWELEEPPF